MTKFAVWTMLALGVLSTAGSASAGKPCHQVCRAEIGQCLNDVRATVACKGLRGAKGRACRSTKQKALRACRSNRGAILSLCRARVTVPTCSPSGAFLDAN